MPTKVVSLLRTLARARLGATVPQALSQLEQAVQDLVQNGRYQDAQQLLLDHKRRYAVADPATPSAQRIRELLYPVAVLLLS